MCEILGLRSCRQPPLLGGQTVVTYRSTVDGSEQPYALYVPKSYDQARRYPVVVSLHAEESNHVVNLRRVFGLPARYGETGLQALNAFPVVRGIEYLVVCPFRAGHDGLSGHRRAGRIRRAGRREAPLLGGRGPRLSDGSFDGRRGSALAGVDAAGCVGGGGAGVRRCVPRHRGSGSERAQSAGAPVPRRSGPGGACGVVAPVAAAPARHWGARWTTSSFPAFATMRGTSLTRTATFSTGSPSTAATPIRNMSG